MIKFPFFFSMSLLYTASFAVAGPFVQFYTMFLDSRGLSTEDIGYAMGLFAFSKIFSVIITASIVSKSHKPHLFLVGACLTAGFIMLMIDILHLSGQILIPMTFLFSLVWSINVPLTEGFAVRLCHLQPSLNYGRMRLFGSLSFILSGLLAGMLIDNYSITVLLDFIVIATILTALSGLLLPDFYTLERQKHIADTTQPPSQNVIKTVLCHRPLMTIIMGTSIMHAGHAVLMQYSAIAWQAQGYTGKMIASFVAVGVIAEIIIFWFNQPLDKKIQIYHYFIIAGLASVIRWIGMSFEPNIIGIFVLQSLHAFTFGALHLGVVRFIRENMHAHYQAASQLIYGGVMWGFVMIPATITAGYLYNDFGQNAYYFMALIAFIGSLILFLPFIPKNDFKKKYL